MNISKFLDDVHFVDKDTIFCDDLNLDVDMYVFATRHQSESGKASLTCHTPGNWNKATMGGRKKSLCVAPAYYLKQFYLALKEYEIDADITLEVTHHGPYLEKPCMFVEVGSNEKQWKNDEYAKIIAECIKKVFSQKEKKVKSCILLGGGHYSQAGNKIMERSEYSVGHICPKYMLEFLDKEMLLQAIEKTSPKPEIILLDWKGMGQEKKRIVNLLDELSIEYKKSKEVLKSINN